MFKRVRATCVFHLQISMISVDALCKRARVANVGGERNSAGTEQCFIQEGSRTPGGENAETARRKPMNKRRILEDRHFSCSRIQPRASFVSGNVACSSPQDSVSRGVIPVGKRKKEGRRRKRCWCNVADHRISSPFRLFHGSTASRSCTRASSMERCR